MSILTSLKKAVDKQSVQHIQPSVKYHRFIQWLHQEGLTSEEISDLLGLPVKLITTINKRSSFKADPNLLIRIQYAIDYLIEEKEYNPLFAINKHNNP